MLYRKDLEPRVEASWLESLLKKNTGNMYG